MNENASSRYELWLSQTLLPFNGPCCLREAQAPGSFQLLGLGGVKTIPSSWTINHLTILTILERWINPSESATTYPATRFTMWSPTAPKKSTTLLRRRAQVEKSWSANQEAPALLATKELFPRPLVETVDRRTTKTGTPAVSHVRRNSLFAQSKPGLYTGCSSRNPLRNSQTPKTSTVIEHHPTLDAVHDFLSSS